MTRLRLLFSALLVLALASFAAWRIYGPVNVPVFRPPQDGWEELLHRRIALPPGYRLSVFARDLDGPRLMQMTADGGLLVSGFTSDSLYLLKPDGDGDGRSDGTTILRRDWNLPHGLLLEGRALYVAEETKVTRYDFDGARLTDPQLILDGLPAGGHRSRTLKRGPDGAFYLSLGSSCNSCIEDDPRRAAILRFAEGETPQVYAAGLRNSVGFDWQPATGDLYAVDNGRDNLGDDQPDDELNRIVSGGHYGWPYVHGKGVIDPDLAATAPPDLRPIPPVHGLGAHRAPLSLHFLKDGSALVTEHGSWNRSTKVGYRIVRLNFGQETSESPFLTGCEVDGDVICRPVDVLEAADGSIYVSDDYAGAILRLIPVP
jgi:glucose/arabinose dehydrogenase